MKIDNIRAQFPVLERVVYGKPLVYLDNAASSQRPRSVIDMVSDMSSSHNANIHRAVHALASEATDAYEAARDKVQKFINAAHREEVIFTSGTTAAINLVAFSFGEKFIREGDEIIVGEEEHHSNLVPWQLLCQRKGATIKVLPVKDNGELETEKLESLISERTRLVAVAHVSNVLGIVNPINEIISIAHSKSVPVLVDGAQGIVHCKVDVQALDCDFYAFSGHKIYAATGTGVLYGKKALLEQLPPYMGGGEMIGTVSWENTSFAPLPYKFEAGTPNMNCVPSLVPAIEFAQQANDGESADNQKLIKEYIYNVLLGDSRIILYGTPQDAARKIPLFSFCVKNVHHEDLALILDKMGIAVRSGHMCAEPLMDRFGVSGMLRASFAPYNTIEEAEYFIKCLDKAIKMLR